MSGQDETKCGLGTGGLPSELTQDKTRVSVRIRPAGARGALSGGLSPHEVLGAPVLEPGLSESHQWPATGLRSDMGPPSTTRQEFNLFLSPKGCSKMLLIKLTRNNCTFVGQCDMW